MQRLFTPQIFGVLVLLTVSLGVSAQCPNADIELGNWMGWTGSVGGCCPLTTPTPGIVPSRHTIMTGNGVDPFACSPIPVVAPGGDFSIRLGNANTGAEAERLQYTFDVTPQSSLIIYQYAVVLEDPSHSPSEQPRFEAQLLDDTGSPIPCTFYQVAASASIEGFESCGSIRSKGWTTVGVDATDYVGSQVVLDIATGDCSQGGHFGYAYVDAKCGPLEIDARYCVQGAGLTAYVSAPEGFASYAWSTGETTPSILIEDVVIGQTIGCDITSVTGCQASLSAILEPSSVDAVASAVASCTGTPVEVVNQSVVTNGIFEEFKWISDEGDTLIGFENAPAFMNPGMHDLKLVVRSDAQCLDTLEMQVQVHPTPEALFNADYICTSDSPVDFPVLTTLQGNDAMQHDWYVDGLPYLMDSDVLPLLPIQPAVLQLSLVSTTEFGCADTMEATLAVEESPEVEWVATDVCEGDEALLEFVGSTSSSNPYFAWANASGLVFSNQPSVSFPLPALGANDVSLSVTENWNGHTCTGTLTQQVMQHAIPVVEWFGNELLCDGELAEFMATSTVPNGVAVDHVWYLDSSAYVGHEFTLDLDTGVHVLSIEAFVHPGCPGLDTIVVKVYPQPTLVLPDSPIEACAPWSMELEAIVEAENLIQSGWTIDGSFTTQNPIPVSLEDGGVMTCHYSAISGDAEHTCSVAGAVDLVVWPLPEAFFIVNPEVLNSEQPEVLCLPQPPCDNCSHQWLLDGRMMGETPTFVHSFNPILPGVFELCHEVENEFGCTNQHCERVEVPGQLLLYVPKAFTPDNDGLNDAFRPSLYPLEHVAEYQLQVFDRWGEVVFETDDPEAYWLGNVKMGEHLSQPAMFIWRINLETFEGEKLIKSGEVYLIR